MMRPAKSPHTATLRPAPSNTCVAALIAGVLILVVPRILNYVVAIYLIVIGILGLVH